MPSISSWANHLSPSGYVVRAVVFSAVGVGLLLAFILLRRTYRHLYFRRLNARSAFFRRNWNAILNGTIPLDSWRLRATDREIVESIVLDQIEGATPLQAVQLTRFLRSSGLLDRRLLDARKHRGWRRCNALLSLGRMRVPEVVYVLAEALEDPSAETRLVAIRGLGRTGLAEAVGPIVQYISLGLPDVAVNTALNALLHCSNAAPRALLAHVAQADATVRPLLARILGEVASPNMSEDVVFFTFDPLPEVRASAARALGSSKSIVALNALTHLLQDPEWFVRLRAAAALGEVNDPRAIPALIAALCDENRLVRLRTAEVLSRFESDLPEILRTVMETKDEYALQAFVAQAERAGTVPRLIDSLGHPGQEGRARAALGDLLQSGAHRMLLDGLTRHPQRRVRDAIARLLADKPDRRLVSELGALLPSQAPRQWRFAVGSARRESNGQHGASDGSKTVFV